ncbi:hypothetical protein E2C01_045010 [Portunus trituberculatus]|uniref:Uncharacterized protein n=1 Tax=Portunus trituberculatus TaxID=210409 RepID=A0A5B7G0Y5_PORTR|nr:hypothetical protein [Portunus trituberculatus]
MLQVIPWSLPGTYLMRIMVMETTNSTIAMLFRMESKLAERRPSEELPERDTAVGGACGGECPSLLRPEDDVSRARSATSREPGTFLYFPINIKSHKRIAPGARGTTYWDYNGNERWLPWTGYLVPMRTSRFNKKKKPHMMRMFVHNRAETPSQSIPAWTPNHPTQDDPYGVIPPACGSAGQLAAFVGII